MKAKRKGKNHSKYIFNNYSHKMIIHKHFESYSFFLSAFLSFFPFFVAVFCENQSEKNHVLGMRSSNNIFVFLRLNSNF